MISPHAIFYALSQVFTHFDIGELKKLKQEKENMPYYIRKIIMSAILKECLVLGIMEYIYHTFTASEQWILY
jgi:hypothetical protein